MQDQDSNQIPSANKSFNQPGWCYRKIMGGMSLHGFFEVSVLACASGDDNLGNFICSKD
jgi:hypothetical protein